MTEDFTGVYSDSSEEENTELFEHYRIVVDKGQTLMRVDKFLQGRLENISRNRVQQAAKAGSILVNDKPVKQNYRVKPDDVVSVVLSYPPREVVIYPEDIPLDVVYEDDDVIVVNKQAGLVVHPGHGNFNGTLLNALAFHFKENGSQVENGFGYLVHRIDKDTTGLMVVAKMKWHRRCWLNSFLTILHKDAIRQWCGATSTRMKVLLKAISAVILKTVWQ